MYILGYGSLINLVSAGKTLQRELLTSEVTVVRLDSYSRVWNYKSRIFVESLQQECNGVYLNLLSEDAAHINAVVFKVDPNELDRLKVRERYYQLVEVTKSVTPLLDGPVFTFICIDADHLSSLEEECVVMRKYIEIVEKGCKDLGDDFYMEFIATTIPFSFKTLPGSYSFV